MSAFRRIFAVLGVKSHFLGPELFSGDCRAFYNHIGRKTFIGMVFSSLRTAKTRHILNFVQCKTALNYRRGHWASLQKAIEEIVLLLATMEKKDPPQGPMHL